MSEYSTSMFNKAMLLVNEENHDGYFGVQRNCIKRKDETRISVTDYSWEHFLFFLSRKQDTDSGLLFIHISDVSSRQAAQ